MVPGTLAHSAFCRPVQHRVERQHCNHWAARAGLGRPSSSSWSATGLSHGCEYPALPLAFTVQAVIVQGVLPSTDFATLHSNMKCELATITFNLILLGGWGRTCRSTEHPVGYSQVTWSFLWLQSGFKG